MNLGVIFRRDTACRVLGVWQYASIITLMSDNGLLYHQNPVGLSTISVNLTKNSLEGIVRANAIEKEIHGSNKKPTIADGR